MIFFLLNLFYSASIGLVFIVAVGASCFIIVVEDRFIKFKAISLLKTLKTLWLAHFVMYDSLNNKYCEL